MPLVPLCEVAERSLFDFVVACSRSLLEARVQVVVTISEYPQLPETEEMHRPKGV